MLEIVAKKRRFFVMVSLAFLVLYSVAIYFISNLNNYEKIKFVVISWVVFIIAFGAMTFLYAIQKKSKLFPKKVWNIILLVFIIFPMFFSIYHFFKLFMNSNAYMIVYPLNGIFSATICVCHKERDDSAS